MEPQRRFTKKGKEVRQRIFAAAEKLYLERGLGNASMRDIAAEAGIEQGLLTYYFKTKTEIFSEGFVEHVLEAFGQQMAYLKQTLASPSSLAQILEAYVRYPISELARGNRQLVFVTEISIGRHAFDLPDSIMDSVHDHYDPLREAYIAAIKDVFPRRADLSELEWAFNAFEGTYLSIIYLYGVRGGREIHDDPEGLIRKLVEFGEAGLLRICSAELQ
jgi:AcrR family transcriptional regulator